MRSMVEGLRCIIPGGVSVVDFAVVAGTDHISARRILNEFVANGIGEQDGDLFNFSETDRLLAAIYALGQGAELDSVAEIIHWRDFEGLAAEILEMKGFETARNLRLKNPTMEIDVMGQKLGITILVDCKHWKRIGESALRNAVQRQIERTKHYITIHPTVAIPVIVTLHQDGIDFVERVPIVPIIHLESFLEELYGNLDEMRQIV